MNLVEEHKDLHTLREDRSEAGISSAPFVNKFERVHEETSTNIVSNIGRKPAVVITCSLVGSATIKEA